MPTSSISCRIPINSKTDEERFAEILHPAWCSADDYYLLQARRLGQSFCEIASELERRTIAVQQRFHRLRAVSGIEEMLEHFGLSDKNYCLLMPVTFVTSLSNEDRQGKQSKPSKL